MYFVYLVRRNLNEYGFSSHKQSKGDSIIINKCLLNEVMAISFQHWLNTGLKAAIISLLLMKKLRHAVAQHVIQRVSNHRIRSWTHLLGIKADTCNPHTGLVFPDEFFEGWTQIQINYFTHTNKLLWHLASSFLIFHHTHTPSLSKLSKTFLILCCCFYRDGHLSLNHSPWLTDSIKETSEKVDIVNDEDTRWTRVFQTRPEMLTA